MALHQLIKKQDEKICRTVGELKKFLKGIGDSVELRSDIANKRGVPVSIYKTQRTKKRFIIFDEPW